MILNTSQTCPDNLVHIGLYQSQDGYNFQPWFVKPNDYYQGDYQDVQINWNPPIWTN